MSLKLKVKLGRISGAVHTCEWCKYSTRSLNLFESHLNKCSPSASTAIPTVKKTSQPKRKKKFWHKCDSCEFTAGMIKEMTRHKAKYHGLKVIPCKECDYLARNRSKLNRHIGYRHSKNKSDSNATGNSSFISDPSNLNLTKDFTMIGSIAESPLKDSIDFTTSHSSDNFKHFDFKLDKYYEKAFTPDVFSETTESKCLTCKFCGCSLANEGQVLNHLQNFHLPNHCIEHEIQTTTVAGKRKSCEISLYRCTSCSFCSEHKMIIVGHILDCHPSCLVPTQPEGASDSFNSSFFTSESSPKREPEKTFAYSCSDCLYKTNFKRNLKLHRTHHGADAPFRCTQCNFAAFHEIAVSRHRNNYHAAGVEKTSFASASAEIGKLLALDIVKEEPVSDFESRPPYSDSSPADRSKHDDRNEQIWQCSFCPSRRYNDQKGLLKHMRIKHSHQHSYSTANSLKMFQKWKCPVCPYIARSRKNLKLHMHKIKHGRLDDDIFQNKQEVKSVAPKSKPRGSSANVQVLFGEVDSKPVFKCEHCPVSFGTYQAIAVHIAKAHKNVVVYKCHDCPFTSNRKYLLRNHLLVCPNACGKDDVVDKEVSEPMVELPDNTESEKLSNQPVSATNFRENTELVKYYGCSKCAYKTFRNFNLKKHIKLIHKGAKMIEILCQEEVHSTQDLEQKVGSPLKSCVSADDDFKNECIHDIDVEKVGSNSSTLVENISPIFEDDQLIESLKFEDTSFDTMQTEKQNVYLSDSKRMKVYKCLFCPKVTRGWNHYILHRKMHFSAVANLKHKCKFCSYCSTSIKFLKKHEMLHKEHTKKNARRQENLSPREIRNTLLESSVLCKTQYSTVPPDYKVKSGYQCDACPFRAKDIKTFFVHKNLHNPRETRYKCSKCTYAVDCVSKLKVHSKVHTVEYLLSNYKAISSKEVKELGKLSQETRLEPLSVGGHFTDILSERNKQLEEVEDYMEVARTKHQLVASKKMMPHQSINFFGDSKLENDAAMKDSPDGISPGKKFGTCPVGEAREINPSSANLSSFNAKVEAWHCERCPFIGSDAESLQRHVSMHLNKRNYECVFCNYSAPTYFYLIEHSKLHQMSNHNLLYAQSANNLQFLDCYENAPADQNALVENLYENSSDFLMVPVKTFKCTFCPFSSKLRIFLIQHLRGHMNQSGNKCPFCTYSSESKNEIADHCRIHFNLPGSEMNAHSESDQVSLNDEGPVLAKRFSSAFMKNVCAQFDLESGDVRIKDEVVDGDWNSNEAAFNAKDDVASGGKGKNARSPVRDCGNKDSAIHKVEDANFLEKQTPPVKSPSRQAAETDVVDLKKDDEEDEYIEIDATEESENCDDAAVAASEAREADVKQDRSRSLSEKPGPPWICKYCGRRLKCPKSLAQHESAHLASCSYLQLRSAAPAFASTTGSI